MLEHMGKPQLVDVTRKLYVSSIFNATVIPTLLFWCTNTQYTNSQQQTNTHTYKHSSTMVIQHFHYISHLDGATMDPDCFRAYSSSHSSTCYYYCSSEDPSYIAVACWYASFLLFKWSFIICCSSLSIWPVLIFEWNFILRCGSLSMRFVLIARVKLHYYVVVACQYASLQSFKWSYY